MAFTVPDVADASFSAQAALDSTDLQILAAAAGGEEASGVLSGCAVSAAAGLSVSVAAGWVQSLGAVLQVGPVASLAIGAATTDRRDLVVVSPAGAVSVLAGRAASSGNVSTKAALPAGYVALAEVYVPGGASSLSAANVVDKSVNLSMETLFIGPSAPVVMPGVRYVWFQTGLGADGSGTTIWVEDGT